MSGFGGSEGYYEGEDVRGCKGANGVELRSHGRAVEAIDDGEEEVG